MTAAAAAVALLSARRFGRSDPSPGMRAAWALGMAGPGLLCLSTVGVLAWVPAALLVTAAVLAVADGAREAVRAVAAHWPQILLAALGGGQLLVAAAAPPWLMVLGAASGLSLVLAAWLPAARTRLRAALVVLGTVPFAIAGWFAVVPVLVAVLALSIAVAVLRQPSRDAAPLVANARASALEL